MRKSKQPNVQLAVGNARALSLSGVCGVAAVSPVDPAPTPQFTLGLSGVSGVAAVSPVEPWTIEDDTEVDSREPAPTAQSSADAATPADQAEQNTKSWRPSTLPPTAQSSADAATTADQAEQHTDWASWRLTSNYARFVAEHGLR